MIVERFDEINRFETERRSIAYTQEFKDLIAKKPGLISIFKSIEKKADSNTDRESLKNSVIEKDGVKVTVLDSEKFYNLYPNPIKIPGAYLKVEFADKNSYI